MQTGTLVKNKLLLLSLFLALVIPLSAFTLYKPIRVITPKLFGVECAEEFICLDDVSKLNEARLLYDKAKNLVQSEFHVSGISPKVIFCSTRECSKAFGLDRASAFNVGTFGIIISERGWKAHLVSHEFIHYWQSIVVGNIKTLWIEDWLSEGMSYSLSNDPRKILSEPFQTYRKKYENWCKIQCSDSIEAAFKTEVNWW